METKIRELQMFTWHIFSPCIINSWNLKLYIFTYLIQMETLALAFGLVSEINPQPGKVDLIVVKHQ